MWKTIPATTVAAFAAAALLTGMVAAPAADMPLKAPPMAPIYDWSGFYVGVNAGGVWDRGNLTDTSGAAFSFAPFAFISPPAFPPAGIPTLVPGTIPLPGTLTVGSGQHSSFVGGGQIGYNWQSGRWVYGLEGQIQGLKTGQDFAFAAQEVITLPFVTHTLTGNGTLERDIQAALRGRLGYTWDRLLVYGTGGVAFTRLKTNAAYTYAFALAPGVAPIAGIANPTTTTTAFNGSTTLTGLTLGAGFQYAFWQNVSIGLDYAHTFYGRHDLSLGMTPTVSSLGFFNTVPPVITPGGLVTGSYRLDTDEVTVRLNWKL
jgi:outer membrane immunogenic protein